MLPSDDPVAMFKALRSPGGYMAAADQLVKYDPEQPRESNGQFKPKSGAGSGKKGKEKTIPEKLDRAEHVGGTVANLLEHIQRIPTALTGTYDATKELIERAQELRDIFRRAKEKKQSQREEKQRARAAGVIFEDGVPPEKPTGSARDAVNEAKAREKERRDKEKKHRKPHDNKPPRGDGIWE